ncbi:MAG: FAD-dependent oxidoreductase, partial [Burkholderiales bacterium]
FHARARQAVITLPVGVLQLAPRAAGGVSFRPALARKQAALKKIDAGAVIKVGLRFRRAFWEKLDGGRYRDAAFLHSAHADFPTFWTALPLRAPLLIAWSGGPPARRLSRRAPADIIELALQSLESVFGERVAFRRQFVGGALHDWLHDPYCRGAYSSLLAGGRGARERLAQPVSHTLFFAGEATDLSGEAATVGGALQSGIRAARELTGKA